MLSQDSLGTARAEFYTSDDALAWTLSAQVNARLWAITYGAGLWVAVGEAGKIYTSPDGVNWTLRDSGGTEWIHGVAYGNGMFLAVSYTVYQLTGVVYPMVLTSSDGITWTRRTVLGSGFQLRSVAFGQGRFVVTGTSQSSIYSTADGITWEYPTAETLNSSPDKILYDSGVFVFAATYLFLSFDGGVSFSNVYPGILTLYGIANGVVFTSAGYTTDGVNFQSMGLVTGLTVGSILYVDNRYLLFPGNGSGSIMASNNGASWQEIGSIPTATAIAARD
jgi:hypothetical protein